jgi:hypothetical protein
MSEFTINVVQDPSTVIDISSLDQAVFLDISQNQANLITIEDDVNNVLLNASTVDLSNYATIPYTTGISGILQTQINSTNQILSTAVFVTGNQDISGLKDFQTRPTVLDIPVLVSGDAVDTIHLYGKNDQGATIYKGQPVYINSANGNNPLIQLASNTGERTSSKTIGLLAQDLAVNEFGYVITEGLLEGFDTSSGIAGDPMWLGPNGNIIYGLANKPYGNNHLVYLGIVLRSNNNNGRVYVKVQNGFEIDELHSVYAKNPSDKNTLLYNSGSGAWFARQLDTGDISGINNYVLNNQTGQFYSSSNPNGYITSANVSGSFVTLSTSQNISGAKNFTVAPTISGNQVATVVNPVRTTLTGNGVLSSFAIAGAGNLTNPSALIVAIDGALQEPSVDYTISGGNVTFTDPLASGAKAVIISPINSLQVGELIPSDGSVTSAKLAPNISITNPTILGNIVGPLSLTNQSITGDANVINRGLADTRYTNRNKFITDNSLGNKSISEQFIDFDDQLNADLNIFTAAGSTNWGASPVFSDVWNAANAGVASFIGNDLHTHRGIFLVRYPVSSNSCFALHTLRPTNQYGGLSNATFEFTSRIFISDAGNFTTQGFFKIGPVPKGGTGGADASLNGGLMFNPYIHSTNLVLAVTKTGTTTPFLFTTNPANVDFLDTGFNFVNVLNRWINISYITYPNTNLLQIIIKREGVVLFSQTYNLQVDLVAFPNRFALFRSGASAELGIQTGIFTYVQRHTIHIDYLYYKQTGTSSAPVNWNELRF